MTNNVGIVSTTLSRTIGGTTTVNNAANINALSGFADVGFIAFDNTGTMGVCTSFTRDENDNPIYVFRTCSLDAEVDIQNILGQSY